MLVFKHPKFYAEIRKRAKEQQKKLRERNKSDQVISPCTATAASGRALDPGHKPQASSSKPQAKPEPSSGS
jgi:K+-transporting ATPase c subunit